MIDFYKAVKNKELLVALYFFLFITGSSISLIYSFYNEFRVYELVVLLVFGLHALLNKKKFIMIWDVLFLLFIVLGSFFWQQPTFVINELLLVYLLYKAFQIINYNNFITKIIVLSSFLLFLFFPLSLLEYIQYGIYNAIWHPLPWNIRVYDSYFLITSIFAIWFYITETKYSYIYLLYVCLAFLAVLLDGGRSVTIAYTSFLIIVSLAYRDVAKYLILVYATSWITYISISHIATLSVVSSNSSSLRILRTATYERFDLLINAYQCWVRSPLFGCGFYQLDNYKDIAAHPHNLFIQLLSETGLIGFSFLAFMMFKIAKNIGWKSKQDYFVIAALLAVGIDLSLSGVHIYPVTQLILLWLFVFLLKNKNFIHAEYFIQQKNKSTKLQWFISIIIYMMIVVWFTYLIVQAFKFNADIPMTPPRFWVYGYKLF